MNPVALITGSSRGIGKAIALKFAKEHYDIILNCRKDYENLLNVKAEIESMGVKCLALTCDVANHHDVKEMFHEIYKNFHRIDVLVNNAGISHIGLFTDLVENEWDSIINSNLKSIYNTCHFALPPMIKEHCGHVINISSMWGIQGASCEVAYSASKGGVNSLTKALAKELGPSNIRVNAIACGCIETSMNNWLDDAEKQNLIEEIPLMRFGKAQEVADLCYFLVAKGSYITGQIISLDGGII